MDPKILIIGAGELGRALSKTLEKKHPILWNRTPKDGATSGPLEEIVPKSDFIILSIPSFAHREILGKISPLTPEKTIIVSLAKGMEQDGKLMPEILGELTKSEFALILGPMIAEEVAKGKLSHAVCATKKKQTFKAVSELFDETAIRLAYSKDLIGTSILSVSKNIYTVIFGISDGLVLGGNTKGLLITKAVSEMQRLVQTLGGNSQTAIGLAGLGDLFTTATSLHSTNREAGFKIARDKRVCLEGEGLHSLPGLKKRLGKDFANFELLLALDKILDNPAKADDYIQSLQI